MAEAVEEILIRQGRLAAADLARATQARQDAGTPLEVVLVQLGVVSERHVAEALAESLGLPVAASADYPDEPLLEDSLNTAFLRQSLAVPLRVEDDVLQVAMADPREEFTVASLRFATGLEVAPVVGLRSEIESVLERLYGEGRSLESTEPEAGEAAREEDIEHLKDLASEAPVIRLVNTILSRALDSGASDIHVEPFENALKVRYRVDGVLKEVDAPPRELAAAVISRIKILSRLNIAERRLPQDGRIQLRIQGRSVDFRVSTVPTLYGESVVMRILDRSSVALDLEQLGFGSRVLAGLRGAIGRPYGIVLVTGPTGSGKTTTLYAALREINSPERKILTVEDPIEYQLEGINQIQVNTKIDLTFARALRAFLRQDPDVILIGEMRDRETANIAIQAALTGHMVLSTLHTNDACSAVTRLLDMEVEDYLITSTVHAVLAQRLVRVLCPHCKESYEPSTELRNELGLSASGPEPLRLWRARGCDRCQDTGFHGRTTIHELLSVDDEIRQLIMRHADAGAIAEAARRNGMRTMFEDGIAKALAGRTSVEEVRRVTQI